VSADPTPHALQRPQFIYANGAIRPWDEATVHVSTEAVIRGINVFEGLKGFWQPDGGFALVAMRRHYDRLHRSARMLHIPFLMTFEEYENACHDLVATMVTPEKNMWLRTTLLLVEGHWGSGDVTDMVITAYHHPKGHSAPMETGVTAWRRANDNALPARIKTGANYLVARFSKLESKSRNYREMILLNDAGRVAEFVGSSLLMVRDGVVITPPSCEGAFEGMTQEFVEILAGELGIPFQRRPIERSELLAADEMASCGTLGDVILVSGIDGRPMGPAPILTRIRDRYLDAVSGVNPHPAIELSVRYPKGARV
jgi:branched-chain amino acid aminotransferase